MDDPAFEAAFTATMQREGGFVLHTVKGDRGGQTYAGIARNFHPKWPGWSVIDRGQIPPTGLVRQFYYELFWLPVAGDQLRPDIAAAIFDMAVNAGVPVACKLAQVVAGVVPDGVIGPKSIAALNAIAPDVWPARYAIARMTRYAEICNRNRSQSKFLLGWTNRVLESIK